MKKVLIITILLVLLSSFVTAVGSCNLDRPFSDNYNPQSTAVFSCTCSAGNERNQVGNIVFRNSSDILSNSSVSTGNCQVSAFTGQFTFPLGADFIGNATFETFAGSWQQPEDNVSEAFNVSGLQEGNCVIANIQTRTRNFVGEVSGLQFQVIDENQQGISGARCIVEGQDLFGNPQFVNPQDNVFRQSNDEGVAVFDFQIDSSRFIEGEQHIFAVFCYCPPTVSDDSCFTKNKANGTSFLGCTNDVVLNISTHLKVNTLTDKSNYVVGEDIEILITANITNNRLLTEVFEITYDYRCAATNLSNNTDNIMINGVTETRSVEALQTETETGSLTLKNLPSMGNRVSQCRAETVVNVIDNQGNRKVRYSTLSPFFTITSNTEGFLDGGDGSMGIAPGIIIVTIIIIFITLSFVLKEKEWKFGTEALRLLFFFSGLFFINASLAIAKSLAIGSGSPGGAVAIINIMYIVSIWVTVIVTVVMMILFLSRTLRIFKESVKAKRDGESAEQLDF